MPSTDTEQLVVLLEARIRDFERNMAKASGTAGREFGAIERRGQQSAKRVEGLFGNVGKNINGSLRGFGGGLLAGGIAGLISEATVRQLGAAVKSVADMADEAERVKLPVEDFQALGFVARQAGIEAGNVTDLFQKFQLSIGEAALKGNDLSKILEANGIKIRDANGKIRDQKSLFYDIVNLIKNAKTQQESAVIAQVAFGKGAKDSIPFLQQGADAIKKGEQAARDVGAVISKELVAKAQEFDDRWTATWDTFSAQGKTALLELLTQTDDLVGKTAEYLRMIGRPIRGALDMPIDQELLKQDTLRSTEKEVLDLTNKRLEVEGQIQQAKTNGAAPIEIQEYSDRLDSVLQRLGEAQIRLNGLKASTGPSFESTGRGGVPLPLTVIPKLSGGDDGETKKAETAQKALEKSIDSRREALRRLLESQGAENRALELEARTMTMATFEAARMRKELELLEQAKQAGLPITDQLKASIGALATEYAKAQVAIEAVARTQELAAESADELVAAHEKAARASEEINRTFASAGKGFLADILAGTDATEALQSALMNLSGQLASMAFDGIFKNLLSGGGAGKAGGGGWIGKLLGLAEGGMVRGPGSGKSDSIPAMVSNGEFVVNSKATAQHLRLLEAINAGSVPKFAGGGLVGAAALPTTLKMAGNGMGQVVNVTSNVNVTVPNGGGGKEGNDALAKSIGAQVEASIKGLVRREILSSMRPGNVLNHV